MTGAVGPAVQVGVGVLVVRAGRVLLGRRLGSHGAGTWAAPGGHLEFGEAVEDCARRETAEETGLELQTVAAGPYTNNVMAEEGKHYITCFVIATVSDDAVARVLEPDKCEQWAWFEWNALPQPLFQPLQSLLASGFSLLAAGSGSGTCC